MCVQYTTNPVPSRYLLSGVPASSAGVTESSCVAGLASCWETPSAASVAPMSCDDARLRLRKRKKASAARTAKPTMLTPTPIPAFAPVESPLVLGEVFELSADEASEFALVEEVVEDEAVGVDEGVDGFDLISKPGEDI